MEVKVATIDSPAAKASVLAMLIATHAEPKSSEVRMLEDADAFRELGISRSEFFRVVDYYRSGPCHALPGRMWLTFEDGHVISEILDKVHDPDSRLLLCRLAQLVIVADGHITEIERQMYDRMLLRWGYTRSTVVEAILARQSRRNRRKRTGH